MDTKSFTPKSTVPVRPVALFIAKQVEEPKAKGEYCTMTDTWSNRRYELTASKKHNEDM